MNCQNCHGEDIIPAEYQQDHGSIVIRPTDQAILSLGVFLKPYICCECGFVSLYVDLRDMKRKINKKLKRGKKNYILIS